MALEQKIEELVTLIEKAILILDPLDLGKDRWANWLRHDAELPKRGDLYGARHLLPAFGGMGSLSDEGAATAETTTGHLFSEVYDLAGEVV